MVGSVITVHCQLNKHGAFLSGKLDIYLLLCGNKFIPK